MLLTFVMSQGFGQNGTYNNYTNIFCSKLLILNSVLWASGNTTPPYIIRILQLLKINFTVITVE